MPLVFTALQLPEGSALQIDDIRQRSLVQLQIGPALPEIQLLRNIVLDGVAKGRFEAGDSILEVRWVPSRGILNIARSFGAAYPAAIEVGHNPGEFARLRQVLAQL